MRLLIIGSLKGQIGEASRIAMERGGGVVQTDDIEGGLKILRSGQGADLVMADVRQDIGELVARLETERMSTPVVACGTATDAKAAAAAIKAGAREYVPLPPDSEMISAVLTAVAQSKHPLIHEDEAMKSLLKMADRVAPSDASVLITGESGTGKEILARYIHGRSRRADNVFVAVNCAAIPENLLESELFGHEKGAFTGAVARRLGKFEEAHNGSLLLDEISEMDARLQAKLLRVIQEKEIDRIGGKKPVQVDVRLIATSNRDLDKAVQEGIFREDLLFRLNVMNLHIPPLRTRPADIKPLAEHFLKRYSESNGLPERPLSDAALKALKNHSWPGNVRELENTLHRAVLMADGKEIGPEAIMIKQGAAAQAAEGEEAGDGGHLVGRTVESVERDLILDTLKHCLGNRTHAANILGISIRTLRNKLKQYAQEGTSIPSPGNG